MLRIVVLLSSMAAMLILVGGTAQKADAAFPGTNGKIVYVVGNGQESEIYIVNANGTSPTRLTNNAIPDYDPSISANGRKIVFASGFAGEGASVFTMSRTGTNKVRVTNGLFPRNPSFSPDGTKIAYLDDGIHIVNVNGTRNTVVPNTAQASEVVYSPTGKKLAFVEDNNFPPNNDIYTINVNGEKKFNVTNGNPLHETSPDFSPDGSSVVFSGTDLNDNAPNSEIYRININGTGRQQLTNTGSVNESPAYSPDGKRVVYRRVNFAGPTFTSELRILTLSGGDERIVVGAENEAIYSPYWGPRPQ